MPLTGADVCYLATRALAGGLVAPAPALAVAQARLRVEVHRFFLDLSALHLEGARLTGAHLEGAFLSGAHLERAELFNAHLEGAELSGADVFYLAARTLAGSADEAAMSAAISRLQTTDLRERFTIRLPDLSLQHASLSMAQLEGLTSLGPS